MKSLKTITIDPGSPTHSVIWLHGLGADAMDFMPIIPHLKCNKHVRFVFPEAVERPVAMNGGMSMRAWYDIGSDFSPNLEQRELSVQQLNALLEQEIQRGIPAEKIVLAGFSQGGIIAQIAALTSGVKVAGVLALSTVLHDLDSIEMDPQGTNKQTPWQIMHGQQDAVIKMEVAQKSYETLQTMGYNVDDGAFKFARSANGSITYFKLSISSFRELYRASSSMINWKYIYIALRQTSKFSEQKKLFAFILRIILFIVAKANDAS